MMFGKIFDLFKPKKFVQITPPKKSWIKPVLARKLLNDGTPDGVVVIYKNIDKDCPKKRARKKANEIYSANLSNWREAWEKKEAIRQAEKAEAIRQAEEAEAIRQAELEEKRQQALALQRKEQAIKAKARAEEQRQKKIEHEKFLLAQEEARQPIMTALAFRIEVLKIEADIHEEAKRQAEAMAMHRKALAYREEKRREIPEAPEYQRVGNMIMPK